jgi:hypothetical protein
MELVHRACKTVVHGYSDVVVMPLRGTKASNSQRFVGQWHSEAELIPDRQPPWLVPPQRPLCSPHGPPKRPGVGHLAVNGPTLD